MCAEATLWEFGIILVLVTSCEPKLKVKVEISQKSSVFTDGNKNNHRDSLFQCSCQRVYIYYIGTSPFSLMGNQNVHEDSFKYK